MPRTPLAQPCGRETVGLPAVELQRRNPRIPPPRGQAAPDGFRREIKCLASYYGLAEALQKVWRGLVQSGSGGA